MVARGVLPRTESTFFQSMSAALAPYPCIGERDGANGPFHAFPPFSPFYLDDGRCAQQDTGNA
jgi:hypothetical protein